MKVVTVWMDVISPYAWLAFQRLPQALEGLSVSVHYRPVLFAGLLRHWGQLGPAEIAPKRDWTYRQVQWLAQQHGLSCELPQAHPFNPLPLLRLLLAHGAMVGLHGEANRHAWLTVFQHVWQAGQAADDAQRLPAVCEALRPGQGEALRQAAQGDAAKQALHDNTAQAVADGVFGVPTMSADGRMFWGFDAMDMMIQHLKGNSALTEVQWQDAARVPVGTVRRTGQ